jgi:hypothetical protein
MRYRIVEMQPGQFLDGGQQDSDGGGIGVHDLFGPRLRRRTVS